MPSGVGSAQKTLVGANRRGGIHMQRQSGMGGAHMVFLRISEWMRATPLTACEPAMHRCAMLMRFTEPSSTSDMRRSLSMSPGNAAATRCAPQKSPELRPGSGPRNLILLRPQTQPTGLLTSRLGAHSHTAQLTLRKRWLIS